MTRNVRDIAGKMSVGDLEIVDKIAAQDQRGLHAVLQAEMPSSNGVGDARSLARLYSVLLEDDNPLLGPGQLAQALEVQCRGPDAVIFLETSFGLGYMLQPSLAPGAGPHSFGHSGAGGSVAFADPEAQIGFAYVMNHMRFELEGDPRSMSLIKAAYESLR